MKVIFPKFSCAGILLLSSLFFFSCFSAPSQKLKQEEIIGHLPPIPSQEIRILTINVWSGLTYKGFFRMGEHEHHPQKRYELLLSEIRRLAPDVVAIQEANPLPHYAKRLAVDLDYEVIFRVALGGIRFGAFGIPTNMREGQATLVKRPWTITELARKRLSGGGIVTNWFSFHFGEVTQTLLGRAVINGKPLYIYNVHLHEGPFKGSALEAIFKRFTQEMTQEKVKEAREAAEKNMGRRKLEIANLIKFLEKTLPPGMPAIVLGDFNTTAESGELNPFLYDGKWIDSFRLKNPNDEGVTWDPPRNPNFRETVARSTPYDLLRIYHERNSYRIDFIFVSSNIPLKDILESRVVMTSVDGLAPSDHYGVLTVLKW